jgi:hypothetical protein
MTDLALHAVIAVAVLVAAAIIWLSRIVRIPSEPEFDGGFRHDNRPRAITRIRCNDMDWEIR